MPGKKKVSQKSLPAPLVIKEETVPCRDNQSRIFGRVVHISSKHPTFPGERAVIISTMPKTYKVRLLDKIRPVEQRITAMNKDGKCCHTAVSQYYYVRLKKRFVVFTKNTCAEHGANRWQNNTLQLMDDYAGLTRTQVDAKARAERLRGNNRSKMDRV